MRALILVLILLLYHTLCATASGPDPTRKGPGRGEKAVNKEDRAKTRARSRTRVTRADTNSASTSAGSQAAAVPRRDWTIRADGVTVIHDSSSSSSSEDDDDCGPPASTSNKSTKRVVKSDEETHVSSSTTSHRSASRAPSNRGETSRSSQQPTTADSGYDLVGWQYYHRGTVPPSDHPFFARMSPILQPESYHATMAKERQDRGNNVRPFHQWFEFDTEARDAVFDRLLRLIMSTLTELSLRTGTHFALNLGRPDSTAALSSDNDQDTWNFVSGSISADPQLRRVAQQLGDNFLRSIHVPLRQNFLDQLPVSRPPPSLDSNHHNELKRAAQPMTPAKVPPAKRRQKQPASRSKSKSSCGGGASEPETEKTPVPAKNKGKSKATSASAEPEQIADDGDGDEEAEEDPDVEKKRMWEEHEARRLWTEAQMGGGSTIEPGPSSSHNSMQNPSFRSSASSRTSSSSRPDSPTPQGVARPVTAPSRDPQLSDEEWASRNGISGQQLQRLKRARLKWLSGAERTKTDLNPLFVRHQLLAESRQQQVNQPPPSTAPERPPTPPTSQPPDTDTTTRIPSVDPSSARRFVRGPSAAGSNSGIDAFEPNLPASIIQYLEQEGFTPDVFMDVEIALGGGGYEDWQERLLRLAALAPLAAKYIALLKWRDRKGDEAEGK